MKKRKDGRYRKSIKDKKTGKTIYFYGESEREVIRKILEYEQKAARGITFKEAADDWWDGAYGLLAVQSIHNYKKGYERAVEFFGDMYIASITAADIRAYLNRLARDGYAQKTVVNHKLVLNRIFQEAVLNGHIQYNICRDVPLPKCKKGEKRDAASKEDEEKVIASANVWIFPYIAVFTGMRKGEILALQWKDVNLDKRIIYVTKSVYHEGNTPHIKEPKTKRSRRMVPIVEPLYIELLNRKGMPDEYLIQWYDGTGPLTQSQYRHFLNHFHKETDTTFTAHRLRHSFATIAFEAGMSAKLVQELLGHTQVSTTMNIYTDFREQSLDTAAKELSAAFGIKKDPKA